jgi:hypothetical protein
VVNQAFALFPASGRILLQCEGSEVFFRRLELLPLNKTPATVPAGRRVKLTDRQYYHKSLGDLPKKRDAPL